MLTACEWPVDYSHCTPPGVDAGESTGCAVLDGMEDEQRAIYEQAAGDYLWNWTGRLFGLCEVVIRPCRVDPEVRSSTFAGRGPHPSPGSASGWIPALIDGQWFNIGCGTCKGSCDCRLNSGTLSLSLPGPVVEVVSVKVDGVELPESSYRLAYGEYLIRTDGKFWPAQQDLLLDASMVDTFEVVYKRGTEVPTGGQIAAGVLACELAKAACNDDSCQLPQRMQTITRQGVTVGFQDDFDGLDKGRVGIWLIDSWVASVNTPRPRSAVHSVDVPKNTVGSRAWPST